MTYPYDSGYRPSHRGEGPPPQPLSPTAQQPVPPQHPQQRPQVPQQSVPQPPQEPQEPQRPQQPATPQPQQPQQPATPQPQQPATPQPQVPQQSVPQEPHRPQQPAAQPQPSQPEPQPTAQQPAAREQERGRPEVTEIEVGNRRYAVAAVEPLDVDGVRTVTVGTALWVVALVALLPFVGTLQDAGHIWWLWTCLAGFGLGLIGIEYCRRRRQTLLAQPERRSIETSRFGAAGS